MGCQPFRYLAASWGIVGNSLLLLSPVYRLTMIAWPELLNGSLQWYHWLCVIASIGFMAYAEGYQGFQQSFSPRVAARAKYLSEHANWLNGLLAPMFCMGYFGATKKRQIASIVLTTMIVLLITLVSFMPQPWRAVVDIGVVVGLLWGVVSLVIFTCMAFFSHHFAYDPELSEALNLKLQKI